MTRAELFDARTILDAVHIGLDFYARTGDYEPIPDRVKSLIIGLTTEHFLGRPTTYVSRVELVKCLEAAVRPWRRE